MIKWSPHFCDPNQQFEKKCQLVFLFINSALDCQQKVAWLPCDWFTTGNKDMLSVYTPRPTPSQQCPFTAEELAVCVCEILFHSLWHSSSQCGRTNQSVLHWPRSLPQWRRGLQCAAGRKPPCRGGQGSDETILSIFSPLFIYTVTLNIFWVTITKNNLKASLSRTQKHMAGLNGCQRYFTLCWTFWKVVE